MALCKLCGEKQALMMSDLCSACASAPRVVQASVQSTSPPTDAPAATSPSITEQGNGAACLFLGVVSLLIGLYFLINPTTGSTAGYGLLSDAPIANMHKLVLGQTFTIVGAIFVAAGIRPRR